MESSKDINNKEPPEANNNTKFHRDQNNEGLTDYNSKPLEKPGQMESATEARYN